MKFYESGDNRKPVIFLFPGTCCLYSSFNHILDGLHSYFYTVAVSYDGFDPNEKTEFCSMEDECEKIEQEIRKKYGGRIKAAYGCSLGGSFVSLLIQRKRIHIDHGIIGSSDMDEAGSFMARIQSSIVVPIMYRMVHTGKLPKFMQKKINKAEFRTFLQLLNPFAPHITEELNEKLGFTQTLAETPWPTFDDEKTKEDVINLPIQVNGKLRANIDIAANSDEETIKTAVHEAIKDKLDGKTIVKEIYVKNRIYNVVVK